MEIIYRYIDNKDGLVKYVGRTKRDLEYRVKEHELNEIWTKNKDWRIDYAIVNNQSYSEALEGHLIAIYQTDKWYNIAKSDWGIMEELIDVQANLKWRLYSNHNQVINLPYDKYPLFEEKTLNGKIPLITDTEICYDFDLPKDEVLYLIKKKSLQPIGILKNDEFLFLEDEIEHLLDI